MSNKRIDGLPNMSDAFPDMKVFAVVGCKGCNKVFNSSILLVDKSKKTLYCPYCHKKDFIEFTKVEII